MMRLSSGLFGMVGLVVALGFLAPAARADEKAHATGTWKWSFTTQNGQTIEPVLKLKQDGDKLAGTITGRQGNETEIQDGKVSGDEISFKVVREFDGNKFVQTYKGKVRGDTIKGKVEFERNGEIMSRDWEAKRS